MCICMPECYKPKTQKLQQADFEIFKNIYWCKVITTVQATDLYGMNTQVYISVRLKKLSVNS